MGCFTDPIYIYIYICMYKYTSGGIYIYILVGCFVPPYILYIISSILYIYI